MAKVIFNGYNNMPEVKLTPLEKLSLKVRSHVSNKAYKDMTDHPIGRWKPYATVYEKDGYLTLVEPKDG